MVSCVSCNAAEPATGWLCEECAAGIHGATRLSPEQIASRVQPANAVLIDRWGRAHALGARTLVGRNFDSDNSLAIADASVSRRHAEIISRPDGTWWIVDLVSSNGTTVDDEPVRAPVQLSSGSAVFVGEVGMLFVSPPPGPMPVPPRYPPTHRPPDSVRTPAQNVKVVRLYDPSEDDEPGESFMTFAGLRTVELQLASPTGGGGGVVELDGRSAQLTEVQYQLVRTLAERMYLEDGRDERVRGFVRSTELLAMLPWDTARPEDNHIKQLVRRVRRTLVRAQIGDVIESRQGFGYRLRFRVNRRPPDA